MNCADVQAQLSPYYDGELSGAEHAAVREHLAACRECASQLAGFERCGRALGRLAPPSVPADMWHNLTVRLPVQDVGERSAERLRNRDRNGDVRGTSWKPGGLAMAASLLLLVGFGLWRSEPHDPQGAMHSHHAGDFAMTMDRYLETLPVDPARAERFLLEKYQGQAIHPDEAVKLVGFRPAFARDLPEGYSLASTSVLEMPCCTCIKTVCKRRDGSTLVLFEHGEDDAGDWFGKRQSRMAMCGDEQCCLVDLDRSYAATWQHGDRSITAVGAENLHEVDRLARWVKATAPLTTPTF